jgi:acetyltransferase-like isoleucine patch superfamily enzyme
VPNRARRSLSRRLIERLHREARAPDPVPNDGPAPRAEAAPAPAGGAPETAAGAPFDEAAHRSPLLPYGLVSFAYLTTIFGLPVAASGALLALAGARGWPAVVPSLLALPVVFTTLFVVTAGLLSLPHRHAIRPGRFPRDLRDATYRARRLYGLCWTSVYYATPLYFLVLALPWLKWLTFRLFGYRGQMQFTVYPDTWIRDLPLLDFGPGAYVANRATLGTNVALARGTLLVDRISIGPGALVGHLTMLSTGTVIEEGAEVGVGCAVGSKVRVGRHAHLGACSAVGHRVEFGERAYVGTMSSIGLGARVGADVRLPQVALVPNRARVERQEDADALLSSVHSPLERLARRIGVLTAEVATQTGPSPAAAAVTAPCIEAARTPDAARPTALAMEGATPERAAGPRWNRFE